MSDTISIAGYDTLDMDITALRPHPRNYRDHPESQLQHIMQSIREHGIYRNVVVAQDGTILAGHGVVKAASLMGLTRLPVVRLDIDKDDVRALKILAGDNEIALLADINDRQLSEILKDIKDVNVEELLGTGYDPQTLAALVMTSRPVSEIRDINEAAEWVGMPDYELDERPAARLIVSFRTEEARTQFCALIGLDHYTEKTKSTWWPFEPRVDLARVKFDA
jgi:hypothetical protein